MSDPSDDSRNPGAAAFERLRAALADRYPIEGEIGRGGMATVYLARDLKHGRPVALKAINPELAASLGAERFLREIEITAKLTHPHILPLYDSGEAAGMLYYVMPFIDGESLRARLRRDGALAVEDAIGIARQIGSALSHAHGAGIVHRDIKPENILLSGDEVLVADFGIARAVTAAGGAGLTSTGIAIGTFDYMAPEQAAGEARIDARADVYALGVVLYEMLAGETPFSGPSLNAVVAKKLSHSVPPLRAVRASVPEELELAIRKALAPSRADRFATVERFIGSITGTGSWTESLAVWRRTDWRRSAPWLVAAAAVALAGAALWRPFRSAEPAPTPVAFEIVLQDGDSLVGEPAVALSPDGSMIAWSAVRGGVRQLFLRRLDSFDVVRLAGTEGGAGPAFSTDGQWISFMVEAEKVTKRVAVTGGTPQQICSCLHTGATWHPDGRLIYGSFVGGGSIWSIEPTSGRQQELIDSDSMVADFYRTPFLLPDGDMMLFTAWTGSESVHIRAADLESGRHWEVASDGAYPIYVDGGYLVFARLTEGELVAAPFDARSGRVTGPIVPALSNVVTEWGARAHASISRNGMLAWVPGESHATVELATRIIDAGGVAQPVGIPIGDVANIRLSPDGTRIVYRMPSARGSATWNLWIHDLRDGTNRQITDELGAETWPTWSADGRRVYFNSTRDGPGDAFNLHWIDADGGQPQRLLRSSEDQQPYSVTHDGTTLAFTQSSPETKYDIWLMDDDDPSTARPIVNSRANEIHPAISPDGQWLAYVSDATGSDELYLQAVSGGGSAVRVTTSGGVGPVWSAEGDTLYYRTPLGSTVFASQVVNGRPRPAAPVLEGAFHEDWPFGRNYDVASDGRFVMLAHTRSLYRGNRIRVVSNWIAELERRMAAAAPREAR